MTHPHRAEEGAGYEATPRDPSAMPSAGVTRLVKNTQRAGGYSTDPLNALGERPATSGGSDPPPDPPRRGESGARREGTNAHITT